MSVTERKIFCGSSGLVRLLRLNLWKLRYCTSRDGRQFKLIYSMYTFLSPFLPEMEATRHVLEWPPGSFKFREQNEVTGSHICWVGRLSSLWNAMLTKNCHTWLSGQVHCEFVTHWIPTLWLFSVYCTISAFVSRNVGSYSNPVKCTDNAQHLCDKKKTISITLIFCVLVVLLFDHGKEGGLHCGDYLDFGSYL
jgi:hypothetical protein